VAIWYIFRHFGILCQEKSGSPAEACFATINLILDVLISTHKSNLDAVKIMQPPFFMRRARSMSWFTRVNLNLQAWQSYFQGDQIGWIFAYWVVGYTGKVF
jgi:hypothetical protein